MRNTIFALICLIGLGASEYTKVRGKYVCCLVIVVIFVGPGGTKRS